MPFGTLTETLIWETPSNIVLDRNPGLRSESPDTICTSSCIHGGPKSKPPNYFATAASRPIFVAKHLSCSGIFNDDYVLFGYFLKIEMTYNRRAIHHV